MGANPNLPRIDNTADVKHMVAFRGSNGQVGGRCAEVTIRPTALPTTGSVWTQTFCYAASEEDDAPQGMSASSVLSADDGVLSMPVSELPPES